MSVLRWGGALAGRERLSLTLHTNALAKGFDGGPLVKLVELPTLLGMLLSAGLDTHLLKGASHKYMRKVWTGSRWRYFYSVSGGGGLGHHDEYHEGAKFKLAHNGNAGHFEVTGKTEDGKLKIKHDESGHEEELHPKALTEMLHREHADALDTHTKKIAKDLKDVAEHGSEKQKARLKGEAEKYGHTKHLTGGEDGGDGGDGGEKDKDKEAAARKKEQVAAVWGDKSGRDKADKEAQAEAKKKQTRSGKGIPEHADKDGDHDYDAVDSATKGWSPEDHDDAAAHHDKAAREADEKSDLEGEDYDARQKEHIAHLDAANQHEDAAAGKREEGEEADKASKGKIHAAAAVMNEGADRIKGIASKGFTREREVGNSAVYRSKDGAISFTAKKDASPNDVAHAFVDEMVRRQLETTVGDHGMSDGEQKTARAVLRRTLDVGQIVGAMGPIGHGKPEEEPAPKAAAPARSEGYEAQAAAPARAKGHREARAAHDAAWAASRDAWRAAGGRKNPEASKAHAAAFKAHAEAADAHFTAEKAHKAHAGAAGYSRDSKREAAEAASAAADAASAAVKAGPKPDEHKERETGPGKGKKGTFGDDDKAAKSPLAAAGSAAEAKYAAQYRKYLEGSGSHPKSRDRSGLDSAAMTAIRKKVDAEHKERETGPGKGKKGTFGDDDKAAKSPLAAAAAKEDAHAAEQQKHHKGEAERHQKAADDLDRSVESRGIHQEAATRHRSAAAAHERLSDSAESRSRVANGHSDRAKSHDAEAAKPAGGSAMTDDDFADNVAGLGYGSKREKTAARAGKAKGRSAKGAVDEAKAKAGKAAQAASTAVTSNPDREFGGSKREAKAYRDAASNHHGVEAKKHLDAAKAADAAGDHDLRDAHVAAGKAHVTARKSGGYHRAMADAASQAINDSQAGKAGPEAGAHGGSAAEAKYAAQYRAWLEGSGSHRYQRPYPGHPKSRDRSGLDSAAMTAIRKKVDAEHKERETGPGKGKKGTFGDDEASHAHNQRDDGADEATAKADAASKAARKAESVAAVWGDKSGRDKADKEAQEAEKKKAEPKKAAGFAKDGTAPTPARGDAMRRDLASGKRTISNVMQDYGVDHDTAEAIYNKYGPQGAKPAPDAPATQPDKPSALPADLADMEHEHIAQFHGKWKGKKGGVNRTSSAGPNQDTQGEVSGGLNVFSEPTGRGKGKTWSIGHEASGYRVMGDFNSGAEAKAAAAMLHHGAGTDIPDDVGKAAEKLKGPAAAIMEHRNNGTLARGLSTARQQRRTAIANKAAKDGLAKIAGMNPRPFARAGAHDVADEAQPKNKTAKRIAGFASKDGYRPNIRQYEVRGGAAIATDGHRAVSIPTDHDEGRFASHDGHHPDHVGGDPGREAKRGDALTGSYHPAPSGIDELLDASNYPHKVTLDAERVQTALAGTKFLTRGAAGAIHKTTLVSKDGELHMHVHAADGHETHDRQSLSVSLGKHEGPDFTTHVNHRYLSEAMKGAKGTVQMGLGDRGAKGKGKKAGGGAPTSRGALHFSRADGERHVIMSMDP